MKLKRDAKGATRTEFHKGYTQTQGVGKTKTIKPFLVSKYGYGPVLVAGGTDLALEKFSFLVQGRDDNKGAFIPSPQHFKLESTTSKALP